MSFKKINSKAGRFFGSLASMLAVAVILSQSASAAVTHQSIGVPVYQYPTLGTFWSDVDAAGGANVPFAVVNDANGTFASADPNYTTQIASNTTAGIRSLGYVYANYQARTFQDVYNDINGWYTYYPGVSGILIDLVKVGTPADLCYISLLTEHIKSLHPNALVILNFGTNVSPDYEPYADIFMNAENTYAAYSSFWTPVYTGFEDNPAYQNRFWQSIHSVSSGAQYTNTLALTRANNAGWVYITDDTTPNAYKVTPSYWSTELTDVATLPHSTIPNRGLSALPAGCQDLTLQNTNTSTTQTRQTTTASTFAVANTSTTYAVDSGTRMRFTLPAGVQVASASGTNWTCSNGNTSCVLGATIAASGSAPAVSASFTTTCDYSSGSVRATLTNFAGNTWYKDVSLTRPGDCPTASVASTLANTGIQTGVTTGVAVLLAGAAALVYRKRRAIHYRLAGRTRSSS
ncbi:MAG TPA: spherulation-specific family 4 protein [Patescibacteria group bacterium]|nr:spherulation-specific family 4 protein [Patescibacteria group bacterium]